MTKEELIRILEPLERGAEILVDSEDSYGLAPVTGLILLASQSGYKYELVTYGLTANKQRA